MSAGRYTSGEADWVLGGTHQGELTEYWEVHIKGS